MAYGAFRMSCDYISNHIQKIYLKLEYVCVSEDYKYVWIYYVVRCDVPQGKFKIVWSTFYVFNIGTKVILDQI